MDKLKKLAGQWSTYRGLFLCAGAAFGLPAVAGVELVNTVFAAGAAVIGAYDTLRDETKAHG